MGKPKYQKIRKKNQKRSEIRLLSRETKNVRRSLQTCSLMENLAVLEKHINKNNGNMRFQNHLKGLKAVLQVLLANITQSDGSVKVKSFIEFDEALSLYLGYTANATQLSLQLATERYHFRELMCNPDHGLCVYLITLINNKGAYMGEFIVARPDEVDYENFFEEIMHTISDYNSNTTTRVNIDRDLVQQLISSMDSEWDKKVLRFVLMSTRSRSEIKKLGMDCDNVASLTEEVMTISKERASAKVAAADMVNLRFRDKILKVEEKICTKQKKLDALRINLTQSQQEDLQDEIQILEEQRQNIIRLRDSQSKEDKQKKNQIIKRAQQQLINEERLGMRKLGGGRKEQIDTEDENFLLHCIESKATAHGRRHDDVMYIGHRVKKKDLLRIVNHSLISRGKAPIKSATTVLNRARPKNKRSIQSSNHLGLGLFCCKKPPKSQSIENELTHYQRSFKKNIIRHLFAGANKTNIQYAHVTSDDDKAYVCPGTSTGVKSAKKLVIYQPSDTEMARKLPKYDFPITGLNITPGTHRIMQKEVRIVDDKEEIKTHDERTFVFLRSKQFIGSTPAVWGSEFFHIILSEPHLFEVNDTGLTYTPEIKRIIRSLQFHMLLFKEVTNKDDISCVQMSDKSCIFRQYEMQRVEKLLQALSDVELYFELHKDKLTTEEKVKVGHLFSDEIKNVELEIRQLIEVLNEEKQMENIVLFDKFNSICVLISATIEKINTYQLPDLRTMLIEFTDAGPGVGVGNIEVKFRAAQKVRILNLDYLIRHHLAPGDSSNEVERVQSLVGDAIVDGGPIFWEHKKRMNADEIENFSVEEIEKLEEERMRHNVKMVCKDLEARIDGSPGPSGTYLKAETTPYLNELYFNDSEYLKSYIASPKGNSSCLPGNNNYKKLETFISLHFELGEKYMEYIKCTPTNTSSCEFCDIHPFRGPPVTPVPKPYPNYDLLPKYHYCDVFNTPTHLDGIKREVDDYQPRIQIKKALLNKSLDISDEESVLTFCKKFIIDKDIVLKSAEHILYIELMKRKREQVKRAARTNETEKQYKDFNWTELVETSTLKKLLVSSLNKYLDVNGLQQHINLKKEEKVKLISAHVLTKNFNIDTRRKGENINMTNEDVISRDSSDGEQLTDTDYSSDDDEILGVVAENKSESDFQEREDIDAASLVTTTRSGRAVWSWSK